MDFNFNIKENWGNQIIFRIRTVFLFFSQTN